MYHLLLVYRAAYCYIPSRQSINIATKRDEENESELEFKMFGSEEGDWFVAATNDNATSKVLYEGHDLECAYRTVFDALGIKVPVETRGMESGNYVPVKKDF